MPAEPLLISAGFTAETCGTCRFGVIFDAAALHARECRGVPPTPSAFIGPDAQGRPVLRVELFRPRVPATDPACSMWKPKGPLQAPNNASRTS